MKRQHQMTDVQAALVATACVCALCVAVCTWVTTRDLGSLVTHKQHMQEQAGFAHPTSWSSVAGNAVHNIEQLPLNTIRPLLSHASGPRPSTVTQRWAAQQQQPCFASASTCTLTLRKYDCWCIL